MDTTVIYRLFSKLWSLLWSAFPYLFYSQALGGWSYLASNPLFTHRWCHEKNTDICYLYAQGHNKANTLCFK